ncbi:Serine carboxypeptidase-like 40 [Diplonema papillatum]|nr:Serine carboxypeptidase-like 40 [Diplonema papillatum]
MRASPAVGVLLCALSACHAAVPADEVKQVPGFAPQPFRLYSGYLTVKGPFALSDYDMLKIHYQLECAQEDTAATPLATWHQGGPGGSSFIGANTEMGYFQVSSNGSFVNKFSWNKVANMLYLESPAGSNDPIGFSTCFKNGEMQKECEWNDRSQAEAYAKTLLAFYESFPELKSRDLYLTGESYAGQYIPNIATYILDNNVDVPLKGIAVGNGCWGGTENSVMCNGENGERNQVDFYYGHGFLSREFKDQVYESCGFAGGLPTPACVTDLASMSLMVGPHNVYDVYDNCPGAAEWYERSGKTPLWLAKYLRGEIDPTPSKAYLADLAGGYEWACGGEAAMTTFFNTPQVQSALHVGVPGNSSFRYQQSGPASRLLYPALIKKIRVLIYNGDADICVPYVGNEEWTTKMAADGHMTKTQAWHPWYASSGIPAGYATNYNVTGVPGKTFTFITIRLAGHMVPTFQPGPALAFITRFFNDQKF